MGMMGVSRRVGMAAVAALAAAMLCCMVALLASGGRQAVVLSSKGQDSKGQDTYRAWMKKSYQPKINKRGPKAGKSSTSLASLDAAKDPLAPSVRGQDWIKHVDPETLRHYYYNSKTGESAWAHEQKLSHPELPSPLPIIHHDDGENENLPPPPPNWRANSNSNSESESNSASMKTFKEFQLAMKDCKDAKTANCREILGVLSKHTAAKSKDSDEEGAASAAEVKEALLSARGYRFAEDKQVAEESHKAAAGSARPTLAGKVEAARQKVRSVAKTLEGEEADTLERRRDDENDLIFGWSERRRHAERKAGRALPVDAAHKARAEMQAVAQQVGVLKRLALHKAFAGNKETRGAVAGMGGGAGEEGGVKGAVKARLREVQERLKELASKTPRGGKYEGAEGKKGAAEEGRKGKRGRGGGSWKDAADALGAFRAH